MRSAGLVSVAITCALGGFGIGCSGGRGSGGAGGEGGHGGQGAAGGGTALDASADAPDDHPADGLP
ncbi:MAG TPA: hypothetical protein VIU64_21100, partial [Polyangia bacterium]